jgi:Tfp pilus assembly protein PilO
MKNILDKIKELITRARGGFEWMVNRFNQFTPREKKIAVFSGIAIGIFLVDALIVRPLKTGIESMNQKISIQEKKTLHQIRSLSQKPKIDASYIKILDSIEIPKDSDEEIRTSMLRDVEQFARASNLYLSEVKPQVSLEKGDYDEFSVRMQVDGTLEELMTFLAELVRTKKLYSVDTLRMVPHPDDHNKIRASITLLRTVFRV